MRNIPQKTNVIIIGNRDKLEMYFYMLNDRVQPRMYNEYKCVKLQVKDNLLDFADAIIQKAKMSGLNEVKREKKKIKASNIDGEVYELKEAWEITLELIPILEARAEGLEDG